MPKVTQQDANKIFSSSPRSLPSSPRDTKGRQREKEKTHSLKTQLQRKKPVGAQEYKLSQGTGSKLRWKLGGGYVTLPTPISLPWKNGGGEKGVKFQSRVSRRRRKKKINK